MRIEECRIFYPLNRGSHWGPGRYQIFLINLKQAQHRGLERLFLRPGGDYSLPSDRFMVTTDGIQIAR